MELPEVLVLAHEILQLFFKIQPADQPRDEGPWAETFLPTLAQARGLHAQTLGGLPMFFAL